MPKIRIISTDQEDERRVSDQRDGGRQLPLVPARVGSGAAVRVRGQAQALQAPLGVLETICGSANYSKTLLLYIDHYIVIRKDLH